ncbi:Glycerophosphocholine phosphodiesterase [Batrachochytrium dendrobatidis]|nr:Glycerophosphocholine phosphodiesterase [Batrachochytrium dendrobatidis]
MPLVGELLKNDLEPIWAEFNIRPNAVDGAILGLCAQHTHYPVSPDTAAHDFQLALEGELTRTQVFLDKIEHAVSIILENVKTDFKTLLEKPDMVSYSIIMAFSKEWLYKDIIASIFRFINFNVAIARSLFNDFVHLLPRKTTPTLPEWSVFEAKFPFLSCNILENHLKSALEIEKKLLDKLDISSCSDATSLITSIDEDNDVHFLKALEVINKIELPNQRVLISAVRNSPKCTRAFFQSGHSLETILYGDEFRGNILHYLARGISSSFSIRCFEEIIETCKKDPLFLNAKNITKDAFDRIPLHYAAIKGNLKCVQYLLKLDKSLDSINAVDIFGLTPLALAATHGHHTVVRELLAFTKNHLHASLISALRISCIVKNMPCVEALLDFGPALEQTDSLGDTLAHFVVRLGQPDLVVMFLKTTIDWKGCNAAGQSPLICASIDGHVEIVKLLLDSNKIDVGVQDRSGLSAHEHAILRGEIKVANLFDCHISAYPNEPDVKFPESDRAMVVPYGSDALNAESLVQIYFGTLDERVECVPVDIRDANVMSSNAMPILKIWLQSSLTVSPPFIVIPLPTKSSLLFPIEFRVADVKDVVVHFEMMDLSVSKECTKQGKLIAEAQTCLMAPKIPMWLEKTVTCGHLALPLLSRSIGSSDCIRNIGVLQMDIVLATPAVLDYPADLEDACDVSISANRQWSSFGTKIVGHRGLGKNFVPADGKFFLQCGENTILSMVKAGEFGAEYVEFDVQLTKDNVPVIYHNFITTEGGIDAPLNALTLEKFLKMHSIVSKQHKRSVSLDDSHMPVYYPLTPPLGRMYPNSYGSIQSPFPTLDAAFKETPQSIGFNIEVKYPTIEESELFDLNHPDINLFCDQILRTVFAYADSSRNIYFSSFHPEICLLLCKKQTKYPVFFLTVGGMEKMCDKRLNSLWNAILFAKRCGCVGIVTEVSPLLLAPRIISTVRRTGLVLFTYGSKNNSVDQCKIQSAYGIDGIIMDKVHHVVVGLGRP